MMRPAAALAIALSGCAMPVSQITMPDGRTAISIGCSGNARSWGSCYEKAGELCGSTGYAVLERSDGKRLAVAGSADGFAGGTIIDRHMVVRCNPRAS